MILNFIEDEKIYSLAKKLIYDFNEVASDAQKKFNDSTPDPLKFITDIAIFGTTKNEWMRTELNRQINKTLQNKIGEFQQNIISNSIGWDDMSNFEGIIDVKNDSKKVVAEIKNRFNTVKGASLKNVYDDLENCLNLPKYSEYTAYYVEMIPKNKKEYNIPFTPSDNVSKINRNINQKIRKIDGKSFYDLFMGKDSLLELLTALPKIISEINGVNVSEIEMQKLLDLIYETYNFNKKLL